MSETAEITLQKITWFTELPAWTSKQDIIDFFHTTMKPYEDTPEDVERALDYVFEGPGGFLMLAHEDGVLRGALLMMRTGMAGYIPENILLFVTVDPSMRGQGLGKKIIKKSIEEAEGNVKLHVEYDNPAKRLYERIGFTTKYAEMRFIK